MKGESKDVLVTGGAGFMGSHIAERLIEMGWEVNGIDLKECNNKDITFIKGNILDKSKVEKAVKGCDYVFHEAAVTAPPEFEIYPEKGYKVNVLGTFNILSEASKAGVGFEKEPIYIKNPLKHYQTFTQADTTKAKKELKFVARFDIKKGVRDMLDKMAKL